jgi:hypothetical protein
MTFCALFESWSPPEHNRQQFIGEQRIGATLLEQTGCTIINHTAAAGTVIVQNQNF